MIAPQLIAPEPSPRPAPPRRDRSREATRRRVLRARRRTTVALVRVATIATVLVLPILIYVMLTANLTAQSYRLAKVEQHRADLLAQANRADDQIAKLESRERLAQIAAKLGMHDPQRFVVLALPPTAAPARLHGIALLGQWLGAAVGASPH